MRSSPRALPWLAVLGVVAAGHLSLAPKVADLDGFYHIGHALAYLEGSIFDTSLPWATRSIIGDIGGDLWWGFHVLLIPIAAIGGVVPGLSLAGVTLTTALALTAGWVLHRHGVPGGAWWAVLFLVAVPNVFFRHLMVRPHVISLAAALALVSVLVRGRWWQALLLAALMSWVHLSLFWFAPGLAVAYSVARVPATVIVPSDAPDRGVPIRWAVPAVVAGTLLGWVARPDAFATASLLNVQLVQLFTQKALDQPLTFAAELTPLAPTTLLRTCWFFLVVWAGSLIASVPLLWKASGDAPGEDDGRLDRERATLLLLGILVSTAFLGLALVSARRALEQWVAFGMLVVPIACGPALAGVVRERDASVGSRHAVAAAAALLLTIHLAWGAQRHRLNVELVAFPANTLQDAANFIEDSSDPGDVVFHTKWDNFGPLFAFNRTNRYLGGMDPIFQYAHDPAAFWEFFYLSADATTEWSCDAFPCREGVATDTHEVLRDHFGARWVVVEPARNPKFARYLLDDARYELALDTPRAAVFEVLAVDPTGGGTP